MTVKDLYKNNDEEELLKELQTPAAAAAVKPDGFDDSAYQASRPTYNSSYAGEIDTLLTDLENRPAFSYDPERDPLYRQYENQYRREGSRAVDDTLAAAASLAGGMNSYAVTAAQQAGDYYNAQLMDRIPELAQLAYEMYQTDYDRDLDRLALLRAREEQDYDRYQDALKNWYTELETAYEQYRDSVADSKWRESFDYEKAQDALAYEKWLQEVTQTQNTGGGQQTQQPESAADRYAGTDYYQDAINAALRGDRDAAEAALARRAEKMSSPDYRGTGGGTSMAAAEQYIDSLLAVSESADIPEAAADAMLSKSEWKESRAAGNGPEAAYDTYEDYVSDYLRYLTEAGV